jgi:hypothetical protein
MTQTIQTFGFIRAIRQRWLARRHSMLMKTGSSKMHAAYGLRAPYSIGWASPRIKTPVFRTA